MSAKFLSRGLVQAHPVSKDKVIKVTSYLVPPRWLFCRVETAEGLVGWGEGTLEGRSATVAAELSALERFVVGNDPANIAWITRQIATALFYHTDGVIRSALAAIDTALWDIQGKRHGAPIHALLGGKVNDRIRCYRWFGGNVPLPKDSYKDQGDSAVSMLEKLLEDRDPDELSYFKMNACPGMGPADTEDAIGHAEAVLRALFERFEHEKVRIGIDCHGRLKPPSARRFLKMAEQFVPLLWFVEEPLRVEEIDGMAELRQTTSLMLATGERFYLPSDFARLCSRRCVDLLQPDLGHCGGISAGRQIADLAEIYQVGFAPHCPNGPILFAASLQLQAYTPAYSIQETSVGIHYNLGRDGTWYLRTPAVLTPDKAGFLAVPTGPGLGIDVDEDRVREGAAEGITWNEASCYLYRSDGGCPIDW